MEESLIAMDIGKKESSLFKDWSESEVRMMSPLRLAYIGDAVYEIMIREYLLAHFGGSMHKLHKESTKYVKAEAQAKIAHMLESKLTEEEMSILKRGRNAKSGTVPKNAKVQDYKYATGFEALVGYLYLLKREDRIMEFLSDVLEGGVIN